MRKSLRSISAALLGLALGTTIVAPIVYAATHSLTYTTAQDATVQGKIIRNYNRRHCAQFGRGGGCSSAQLVSNGCIPVSICTYAGLKVGSARCTEWSTEFVESCTIFPETAPGEAAYLKEMANKEMASEFAIMQAADTADFCAAWELMSNSAQNTLCTTAPPAGLGLSNNCRPCPEKP